MTHFAVCARYKIEVVGESDLDDWLEQRLPEWGYGIGDHVVMKTGCVLLYVSKKYWEDKGILFIVKATFCAVESAKYRCFALCVRATSRYNYQIRAEQFKTPVIREVLMSV